MTRSYGAIVIAGWLPLGATFQWAMTRSPPPRFSHEPVAVPSVLSSCAPVALFGVTAMSV
jgi:hypothetical protein